MDVNYKLGQHGQCYLLNSRYLFRIFHSKSQCILSFFIVQYDQPKVAFA
jgi:hypothetical protein